MQTPYNDIYKKQNTRLLQATFKKGVIVTTNVRNWTADIYLVGSPQNIIKGVPLASSINILNVIAGQKCRLDLFDETNPNDMVIAYTYGSGSQSNTQIAQGGATVAVGGTTIAHGLPNIPQVVGFIKTSTPDVSLGVIGGGGGSYHGNIDVFEYQPADATNIYLKSVNGSMAVNWFAIRF